MNAKLSLNPTAFANAYQHLPETPERPQTVAKSPGPLWSMFLNLAYIINSARNLFVCWFKRNKQKRGKRSRDTWEYLKPTDSSILTLLYNKKRRGLFYSVPVNTTLKLKFVIPVMLSETLSIKVAAVS